MSHANHQAQATGTPVRCAVFTISDTRTPATDTSGQTARTLLEGGGAHVVHHTILPDDPETIRDALFAWDEEVDVIVTSGGTGFAGRDVTADVAERLIETPMPGFGELFRMRSFDQIGPAAMMSRATAGVLPGGSVLFCLPGSTNAVTLALNELIVPQLRHLVWERHRQSA